MITLTSASHINASPKRVWHFLTHLHESDAYQQWHPVDHQSFTLVQGDGETVGSVSRCVETLGKNRFTFNYRLNHAEPSKYLEYEASGLLRPLHLASGTFTITPRGKNKTELVAKVHIGYRTPIIGGIIDWIARRSVNLDAISRHMNEESYYLNKALGK